MRFTEIYLIICVQKNHSQCLSGRSRICRLVKEVKREEGYPEGRGFSGRLASFVVEQWRIACLFFYFYSFHFLLVYCSFFFFCLFIFGQIFFSMFSFVKHQVVLICPGSCFITVLERDNKSGNDVSRVNHKRRWSMHSHSGSPHVQDSSYRINISVGAQNGWNTIYMANDGWKDQLRAKSYKLRMQYKRNDRQGENGCFKNKLETYWEFTLFFQTS